jgi:glycosyltransferase involved in cell wall biosynthesis
VKNKPIRVLHALRVMNRAGIETWLMHLLRRFDRREIAIDFLVQTEEPGAFDEEIRSLGARILLCLTPSQPWRYAWNLRRILTNAEPYDVVHSHNYFFAGLDLKVAAQAGVRHRIAHMHPHRDIAAERPFRSLYRGLMCNWIRSYSTCILAPSQTSLDAFSRYVDCSATPQGVVWNCVDLSAYSAPIDKREVRSRLGLPPDVPLIVYVARFAPHKNHLFLASVADRLDELGVPAAFAVAGSDGEARQAFEQRVAGRSNFSIFVNTPDISPLLRCADLFLFPSSEEGFGTVAIEAAAAGLPVVATELPAVREACAPSHRNFMFAAGDDLTAALNIQAILADRGLHRQLRNDAIQWAKQFSIEPVAEQVAEIYRTGHPSPAGFEAPTAEAIAR